MNESTYRVETRAWPHAHGRPLASGVLRRSNEDFQVEEVMDIELEGDGPHLWLWIEKCGANTEWVAGQVARLAGVKKRDVGFAGMKDRHAVTRQWFSLPVDSGTLDWSSLEERGIRVLKQVRHRRKLKRGAHRANRFVITLREVEGDADLDARLDMIRREGVPNLFGPQRFGRNGDNVIRALDGARGGIYLSAVRSFIFNSVLVERIRRGDWNRKLDGEALQLAGSGSFFTDDGSEELERRIETFDIHPSGPMWGRGDLPCTAEARELELEVASRYPEAREFLEASRLKQERRSLRLATGELQGQVSGSDITLEFELETGAFATSVLREIINLREPEGDTDA